MAALDVIELLDLLGQGAPFLLELGPAVGERRGLPVHSLDVGLQAFPLLLQRVDTPGDILQTFVQPFPFALGRREAPAERLHLGTSARRLLPHPAAHVLDLPAVLLRHPELLLRSLQLVLAGLELGDDAREILFGPGELAVDSIEPCGSRGLGRQGLACDRLSVDSRPEGLIGIGAFGLGCSERLLRVGEPTGGGGASIGRLEDLPVEAVEQLPGGLARLEALVPPVLAPILLTHQRPQARGRQLARELLGLLGQRLVLLGHLGLLLQRLQLPAELRQHILQAQEILVEPRELALRSFLAAAMLRDAGGLLDVSPTFLRSREQDLFQLALAHHGMERATDPRLGQELLDVEQPHDLAVDAVFALAAAEDRATDLDLGHRHGDLARGVVDHQLHLGHAERRARRRPGEDDVSHVPAAEGARALLAERPADRVHQVRLARSVGTDDHADARDELQNGFVRERLEAADLDLTQEHSARC